MRLCLIGLLVIITLLDIQGHHISIERTAKGCPGTYVELTCADITLFRSDIEVISAHYGRTDPLVCANNYTNDVCDDPHTLENGITVAMQCDAKQSCNIYVDDDEFGDHCPGVDKYLQVEYSCIEDHPPCDVLPAEYECKSCSYCSECSKTCGFGIAWVVIFCKYDPYFWLPPRVCTIPCCIEPCGGHGHPNPNQPPCTSLFPHGELACLGQFKVEDWYP